MPNSLAYPKAAALLESGTEITKSTSAGCSFASSCPILRLIVSTYSPKTKLSGLAKYIYSNIQCFGVLGSNGCEDFISSCSMIKISPGLISLIKSAPIISKAHDSDAIITESFNFPILKGLKP